MRGTLAGLGRSRREGRRKTRERRRHERRRRKRNRLAKSRRRSHTRARFLVLVLYPLRVAAAVSRTWPPCSSAQDACAVWMPAFFFYLRDPDVSLVRPGFSSFRFRRSGGKQAAARSARSGYVGVRGITQKLLGLGRASFPRFRDDAMGRNSYRSRTTLF